MIASMAVEVSKIEKGKLLPWNPIFQNWRVYSVSRPEHA